MQTRSAFHEDLDRAENDLLYEGSLVREQLEKVVDAVVRKDSSAALEVIAQDAAIDALHTSIHNRLLQVIARQTPVASDLRLVSALLHCTMHLERMGDYCVNVAKFVLNEHPYPGDAPMVTRLQEMGTRALALLDQAMAAFTQRDLAMARALEVHDTAIDELNRGMVNDLKEYAGDESCFEWAVNLALVARHLERFGDHAVDIGEQVDFLVTGIFHEFSDASDEVASID